MGPAASIPSTSSRSPPQPPEVGFTALSLDSPAKASDQDRERVCEAFSDGEGPVTFSEMVGEKLRVLFLFPFGTVMWVHTSQTRSPRLFCCLLPTASSTSSLCLVGPQ